ncbi:MAG TPA: hypothetical protein VGR51_07895, partial [Thermoplasmata archaeon]|nr:hypothetical protein [Thermoplasmata archaeon]
LFLIFLVDAAIFPALPEVFIVAFYFEIVGRWLWSPVMTAVVLLALALAGDVAGNALVYGIVRRMKAAGHLPQFIERAMRKWTSFLAVQDERLILMNRIAPAVPLTGAFIAVCGWSLRKSLAYVVIGGAIKYVFLLALVIGLGVAFDPGTARLISFSAVILLVAASFVAGWIRRRKMVGGA